MFTYMEKQAYDHYYEMGRQLAFYKLAKKDKPPAKQVMSFPPKKITPSKSVRKVVGDKSVSTSEKLEEIKDIYDYDKVDVYTNAITSKGHKAISDWGKLKKKMDSIELSPPRRAKPVVKPVVKPKAKGPVNFYGESISPITPVSDEVDGWMEDIRGRVNYSQGELGKLPSALKGFYEALPGDARKILGPKYMDALPKKKIPKVEKPRNDTKATFGRMQPMKMSK